MGGPPTTQQTNSATPAATAGAAAAPPPSASPPPAAVPEKKSKRYWSIALIVVLAVVAVGLIVRWAVDRATSSVTDDAFIEAHIVNIAPQAVSGHLVRYLVDENERVQQGQLLAEIDPVPYRDQVELARSKVDAAEVELQRQQAALDRLKLEVPIQIEISRRSLAAAQADQARAKE